ncbi:hypothetical protein IscW_ISCW016080, partial [Ixodes scapularis]
FKGLIVGVIMAMIISSTNSYINVAAVTFINDIIKKASLNYNYITAITIGLIGFIISLYMKDLINLFLFRYYTSTLFGKNNIYFLTVSYIYVCTLYYGN